MKPHVTFATAELALLDGHVVGRAGTDAKFARESTTLLNPKHYPATYAEAGLASVITSPARVIKIENDKITAHDYVFTDEDRKAADWIVLSLPEQASDNAQVPETATPVAEVA